MAETYKKIDKDTLEITSTHVHQSKRKHLESEKQRAESDMVEAQRHIDEVNIKLTVLNKISGV